MSPHLTSLFRSSLAVWIGPGRVRVARSRPGFPPRREPALKYGCSEPAASVPAWQPAIYAFEQLLAANPMPGSDANITISNHFVRYAVVPETAGPVNHAERVALARAAFRATYGEQADQWRISISSDSAGVAFFAAAIEGAFADAIDSILATARVRMRSMRPLFAEAFDASRAVLPEEQFWFAVAERDHVVLAFSRAGAWEVVRARRLTGPIANDLLVLLDQARFVDAVDRPAGRVFLHAAGRSSIAFPSDSQWRVKNVAGIAGAKARTRSEAA